MSTVSSTDPNPVAVFDTLLAYQRTAALRTAIEIELFRALGESPGTPAMLDVTHDPAAVPMSHEAFVNDWHWAN